MSNVIDFNEARKRKCHMIYNFEGHGKVRITIQDAKTGEVLMNEAYDEVPASGEHHALASYFLRTNPDCYIDNST
jgi:hypothetical protein